MPPRTARCPVCGKLSEPAFRPFCSARCKQVDLGRWLNGGYAIPGAPAEPEEDER
ncbi:MAG TPA: DNA gyrase inhibitor YacG [Roseomonas sp.]|nr:DNA gyrase inhibitor YacG [Roseomonas sp.]